MGLSQAAHFWAYRLLKHFTQYGSSPCVVKGCPASWTLQPVHKKHSLCQGSSLYVTPPWTKICETQDQQNHCHSLAYKEVGNEIKAKNTLYLDSYLDMCSLVFLSPVCSGHSVGRIVPRNRARSSTRSYLGWRTGRRWAAHSHNKQNIPRATCSLRTPAAWSLRDRKHLKLTVKHFIYIESEQSYMTKLFLKKVNATTNGSRSHIYTYIYIFHPSRRYFLILHCKKLYFEHVFLTNFSV